MPVTSPHRTTLDVGGPVPLLRAGSDGPPVVLVHGLDGSAANWWDVLGLLGGTHRVTALDLPGFGRSPLGRRRSSMTSFADLVAETIHALDEGPAVVAGNSMGAVVALLTAARHREAVAGVSLVAPALPRQGTSRIEPGMLAATAALWLPGLGSATGHARAAQRPLRRVTGLLELCMAPDRRASDAALKEMVAVAEQRQRRDQVRGWTGAARSLWPWLARRGAFHDVADRVTAPVQVIEGALDPIIPASSVQAALRRHPSWTHVRLDGVGHVPPLEAPRETATALASLAAHRR